MLYVTPTALSQPRTTTATVALASVYGIADGPLRSRRHHERRERFVSRSESNIFGPITYFLPGAFSILTARIQAELTRRWTDIHVEQYMRPNVHAYANRACGSCTAVGLYIGT